jgi:hypothetical protein
MKKKEDARLAVLREYDRWAKANPNDAKKMGGFVFFAHLEKERPDLLEFRAAGSKWQIVHLWLPRPLSTRYKKIYCVGKSSTFSNPQMSRIAC